ncbi:MAG TPA: DegT/DnrJ/EryC1/StrS family aminotransferase, partial [Epulopiscium sp.]|nr:DegT/DnrJ/EryC1/StrS family aminotransferase [Candidatus Epulonipiscium sp.]
LYEKLKANNIFSRRYFYPLISNFPTYSGLPSAHPNNLPIANKVSSEVLCLPIYADLEIDEIKKVIDFIYR